jgi:uncharacterized membrane protein
MMMQFFRQGMQQDNETGRLEAFSDGVIAIIITLLVFSIQIPSEEAVEESGLIRALLDQWPTYLAFTASFFFILVMWMSHHRLFKAIRYSDNNLILINGLVLFSICVVPFPTALVAQYVQHEEKPTAVMIYNGWFLVIGSTYNLLRRYASHKNRLFSKHTDPELVAYISRRFALGPLAYLAAVLLAFISPALALTANIMMAIYYALPNRAIEQLAAQQIDAPPE